MKGCLVSYPCRLWSQENHSPLWTVGALPQYKNYHLYFQVTGAATVSHHNDKKTPALWCGPPTPCIVLPGVADSRDIQALTRLTSSFKIH